MIIQENKIKQRILFPIFGVIIVLMVVSMLITYQIETGHIDTDLQVRRTGSERLLERLIDQEIELLESIILFIENDPSLAQSWLKQDRNALATKAIPVFKTFHNRYQITHLYFITPGGNVFFRAHRPDDFGDTHNFQPFKQSTESGKPDSGIKIGKHEPLNLHLVKPWKVDGKLTGYIEIATEATHLTPKLKQIMRADVLIAINKEHLTPLNSISSQTENQWGNHIILSTTLNPLPEKLISDPNDILLTRSFHRLSDKGRDFGLGFIPLIDKRNVEIGAIGILFDITHHTTFLKYSFFVILVVFSGLSLILLLFFHFFLGRIQGHLVQSRDQLQAEINIRRQAEEKLRQNQEKLQERVSEKTLELSQTVERLRSEIAERQNTAEALRESLQTSEDIIRSIPIGLFIFRYEAPFRLVLLSANSESEKLTSINSEHCIDMEFDEIFQGTASSQLKRNLFNALNSGEIFDEDNFYYQDDRFEGHFKVRAFRISENRLGVAFESIDQRLKAEGEAKHLQAQLLRAQKMEAIGTLAGGIAHDFNNILAAIIGYSEISELELADQNTEKAERYLKNILHAGNRAKNLVDQILAFSRNSDNDKIPLTLISIVKETAKLLKASLPATIEVKYHGDSEESTICADPTQIHQILMNLCTNAAHAMDENGGILSITVSDLEMTENDLNQFPELSPGPHTKLSVIDNGHGMDPATLERIFDPYFTTKSQGKGTGLGLAVVHGIVGNHQGTIRVFSRPKAGTTVDIYFPIIKTDIPSPTPSVFPVSKGTGSILFIDDEESLAELGQQILERLGYQVTSCTNPEEALENFTKSPEKFDVVVTDMTMPHITGDRLASELLKVRPDIPIILCTGFSDKMNAEKARSLGIRHFMIKPYDIDELAIIVQKLIGKSAQ